MPLPARSCLSSARQTVQHANHDNPAPRSHAALKLSDGEVDFLWWFIQGSIMDADVRTRLYDHWGMCPRHALAFVVVEAAFRPHLIHGSTILYTELMRRAARALGGNGLYRLAPEALARHRLRSSGPCHMCGLGYGPDSAGNAPAERLAKGRDLANARSFATDNRNGWLPHVCGQCADTDSPVRCRPHLIHALEHDGSIPMQLHRDTVESISTHLAKFEHAFRWDSRGTDADTDRGALVAAIGWCSGWHEILATFDSC